MRAWRAGIGKCCGCLTAALVGIGLACSAAQAERASTWLTGVRLQRRLAQPVDVYWSGTPLRDAVGSLSRAYRVAVLIDRRVDPGQKVDLKLSGRPLASVFRELAESRGLGVCWLGPVAYVGPQRPTSRLRTLAQLRRDEVRGLPAAAARKFLLPGRIQWEDFTTPRDLLGRLGSENDIQVLGLDQVPHDLWAGADLAPLSLVDRLTLIAGQFDLTFQIARDGGSIALVPVPEEVSILRTYPGGRRPDELAAKWAALIPQSEIQVVGREIHVRGRLEDHERIADPSALGAGLPSALGAGPALGAGLPTSPRRVRGQQTRAQRAQQEARFTGKVSGQLGELLEALAARFQLKLDIDHEALDKAGISLHQPVSVTVQDATVDQLLEALLFKAGCTFRRDAGVIRVLPAG